MRSPFPRLAAVALVALVPLAALGAAGALAAAPKPKAEHAMMEFSSGAKLSVIAPTPNTVITGNSVATKFAVTGFKLDSGLAGTKSVPRTGHLHIMLDRALIDMYGTPDAVISLQAATLEYAADGGGVVSYVKGVRGGFTIASGAWIENAKSGSGDDWLQGSLRANTLDGRTGRDTADYSNRLRPVFVNGTNSRLGLLCADDACLVGPVVA